ncbi:MAG: restriction endonuclease subunit S [Gammaproteobacteria bacterium]|nr:MAG: restriction endonuclease subunit S [Gammaproteobacteria bacterium]
MSSEAMQVRDAGPGFGAGGDAQEVPAGYKRTELGVVPDEWETCQLSSLGSGSILPIKAGPFGSSLTKATYVPDGYKVYGQEQVIRGDHLYGDYYITRKKYLELESCAVRAGDILISLVGTAGKLLVVPDGAPPGIINPRLIRFSFDRSRVNARFFQFLFESEQVQDRLARQAQGGTMGVLNAGNLRPFRVQMPRPREQRAIAEALSDVDGLLGALEVLIAKKRAIKQAAMQQLLTGKTRLPGFSGEWETKRLSEDVTLLSGHHVMARDCNSRGVGIPYLTGPADFPCRRIQQTKFTVRPTTLCRQGDILVTVKGSGSGTLIEADREYCISRQLMAIRTSFWNSRFLFCCLLQNASSIVAASTGLIPGLSRGDILEQELPIPPDPSEQDAIATVISDMDSEIAALEARRDKTRAIKQGMMQQLLTGRVRLVKPEAAA